MRHSRDFEVSGDVSLRREDDRLVVELDLTVRPGIRRESANDRSGRPSPAPRASTGGSRLVQAIRIAETSTGARATCATVERHSGRAAYCIDLEGPEGEMVTIRLDDETLAAAMAGAGAASDAVH